MTDENNSCAAPDIDPIIMPLLEYGYNHVLGPQKRVSSMLLRDLLAKPSFSFDVIWNNQISGYERAKVRQYANDSLRDIISMKPKERAAFLDATSSSISARIVLNGHFDRYLNLARLRFRLIEEHHARIMRD
ncbi:hypothetical protein [Mesorhizobium sp. M7A.F.Ce.TU.012.03.2.1]|uniref:hypothetical protein n=1 Tax=Mesorhizobium sp. M7A.F.Ce.TU.012.03.2.1 TaxID=2493681 RepID=UPI000FD7709A|nr:hypothetical protein [Mesorhizobium sp. M7A.F.Ce.TU.012.03.2.1]AZV18959.1 hypothetical protein EJ079_07515 [Mesorhizobium sp. M7A.F.Ce.TU.012.03.2.1]